MGQYNSVFGPFIARSQCIGRDESTLLIQSNAAVKLGPSAVSLPMDQMMILGWL